ncbi:putative methylated DNA-protein cysteine methyltransferase [Thermobacillus composti KWC4]|uniref:Putative methylated DNA-protein cysteine methyltransferase n=1 Tax=Thermobacillus composti (strain DSM 18247 / JCM 13945 / KWC4) TaxID=717605 RepID=L0EAZ8_THECK|nr:MGMT family protein [Thermobacillus composti]AGA56851.1 putative methylated DNA-protein cysteine methyltransferase [Thermobacillus composti KWC4]
MTPFTARVVRLIQGIPEGRVMTYGQIARRAGSPRGARQVVRILHAMSERHRLPWHRVVNARGEIAIPDAAGREMQAQLLRREGVAVDAGGRVDLARFMHEPEWDAGW